MESLTCIKCGNGWTPRKSGRPLRCPACGSRAWDTDGGETANDRAGSGSGDAKPSRRIVLDETQAERVCEKCEHEWAGPKYKHCPACDRPRWWEPRQQTKAERKSAERKADAERRKVDQQRCDTERNRDAEEQRALAAAEHEYHARRGDVINDDIWGGPKWITFARAFDRAWRDYEDAAEADRSGAEHERRLDRERAEREREIERKMQAEEKAAQEKRERAIEQQRQRVRVQAAQAAQKAKHEAWLDARWHRRPCAALASTASAILNCVFERLLVILFAFALIAGAIAILELVVKPALTNNDGIVEIFRSDEIPPPIAATPTPNPQNIAQTEEYWLERRRWLQEGFDFWADAITARTVRDERLPNNVTLEYARESLESFRTELRAANLRLQGFANGNN